MKKLIGMVGAVLMLVSVSQVANAQMVGKIEISVQDAIKAASSVSEATKIAQGEKAERKAEQLGENSADDSATHTFNGVKVPADMAKQQYYGTRKNVTRREDTWKGIEVVGVDTSDRIAPYHCEAEFYKIDDPNPLRLVFVLPDQPGKNALCNSLVEAVEKKSKVDVDVFGIYIWETGDIHAVLEDIIIHYDE